MSNGRRRPLTSAQIDGRLGNPTTQAQLVLGSAATGVEDVADAVTEIVNGLGSRYKLATRRGAASSGMSSSPASQGSGGS